MIKTYQRSKMTQARTKNLALLSIERKRQIDIGDAVDRFARMKKRRKDFIL